MGMYPLVIEHSYGKCQIYRWFAMNLLYKRWFCKVVLVGDDMQMWVCQAMPGWFRDVNGWIMDYPHGYVYDYEPIMYGLWVYWHIDWLLGILTCWGVYIYIIIYICMLMDGLWLWISKDTPQHIFWHNIHSSWCPKMFLTWDITINKITVQRGKWWELSDYRPTWGWFFRKSCLIETYKKQSIIW